MLLSSLKKSATFYVFLILVNLKLKKVSMMLNQILIINSMILSRCYYKSSELKQRKFNHRKSLQFYRGHEYDIAEEFDEIFSHNQKKALQAQHSRGWKSTLKRLTSSAFGRPFLCIGVLSLILQWGESTNLTIHMISIFREYKSSIEPELAPVFVGLIQVKISAVALWLCGFLDCCLLACGFANAR